MSTLTITIDMGNAAFEDDAPGIEVTRILHHLAGRIEQNPYDTWAMDGLSLRDINGNTVGRTALDASAD